ncbi:hypothetical protein EMIT051CA3_110067 [Pseudomonas chlororaphis]
MLSGFPNSRKIRVRLSDSSDWHEENPELKSWSLQPMPFKDRFFMELTCLFLSVSLLPGLSPSTVNRRPLSML